MMIDFCSCPRSQIHNNLFTPLANRCISQSCCMLLFSRCHQNDLENIIPFVVIGLLYTLTGPELSSALLHFRLFAGSRIVHTIAYAGALPQPSRALSWLMGMLVTFSMAYRVLSTVLFLQRQSFLKSSSPSFILAIATW